MTHQTLTATNTQTMELSVAYRALRQTLLGFLRKKVSDPAVAEDLLHEVFLKALTALERGNAPSNMTGWLYTIARNGVIDFYRSKRPTEVLPEDLAAVEANDDAAEQQLALCLKPFTEELPSLYRETLLATDFDGRILQDLATQWDVSVSAVKSRASRGRKLLKQRVLDCCKVEVSSTGHVLDYHPHVKKPDASESHPSGPARRA